MDGRFSPLLLVVCNADFGTGYRKFNNNNDTIYRALTLVKNDNSKRATYTTHTHAREVVGFGFVAIVELVAGLLSHVFRIIAAQ